MSGAVPAQLGESGITGQESSYGINRYFQSPYMRLYRYNKTINAVDTMDKSNESIARKHCLLSPFERLSLHWDGFAIPLNDTWAEKSL